MLLNNYGRLPIPYQLVRDLLRTHWNEDFIPRPIILERPTPEYQRVDLYNHGPHLVISVEDVIEELIHIGFRNLNVTVPINIEILTAGRPQEMMNTKDRESDWERHQLVFHYAREIQRIILSNQHDPNVYLLTDMERDEEEAKWSFPSEVTIELDNAIKGYGERSLKIVNTDTTNEQTISISLPPDERVQGDNSLPLVPRPGGRLRALKLFAGTNSTSAGMSMEISLSSASENLEVYNGDVTLEDWDGFDELSGYFLHLDSYDLLSEIGRRADRATDWVLSFTIPANTTVWLDHIVFSTCEYQMLLYQQFQEDLDDYQFHSGIIRATFRSVGDPVDTL